MWKKENKFDFYKNPVSRNGFSGFLVDFCEQWQNVIDELTWSVWLWAFN